MFLSFFLFFFLRYFWGFLCLYCQDRTAEEWTGNRGERGNDMQQRATGGIEPGSAARGHSLCIWGTCSTDWATGCPIDLAFISLTYGSACVCVCVFVGVRKCVHVYCLPSDVWEGVGKSNLRVTGRVSSCHVFRIGAGLGWWQKQALDTSRFTYQPIQMQQNMALQ